MNNLSAEQPSAFRISGHVFFDCREIAAAPIAGRFGGKALKS